MIFEIFIALGCLWDFELLEAEKESTRNASIAEKFWYAYWVLKTIVCISYNSQLVWHNIYALEQYPTEFQRLLDYLDDPNKKLTKLIDMLCLYELYILESRYHDYVSIFPNRFEGVNADGVEGKLQEMEECFTRNGIEYNKIIDNMEF